MKRMALILALTFAVGIVVGVVGNHALNAQQKPLKVTELLKADIVGVDGKEVLIRHVEFLAGGASGTHHHPAQTFVYVMEGAITMEAQGKPPHTVRAGEVLDEAPGYVHDTKNLTGSPAKVLVFRIHPKGQPETIRATDPYFVK